MFYRSVYLYKNKLLSKIALYQNLIPITRANNIKNTGKHKAIKSICFIWSFMFSQSLSHKPTTHIKMTAKHAIVTILNCNVLMIDINKCSMMLPLSVVLFCTLLYNDTTFKMI